MLCTPLLLVLSSADALSVLRRASEKQLVEAPSRPDQKVAALHQNLQHSLQMAADAETAVEVDGHNCICQNGAPCPDADESRCSLKQAPTNSIKCSCVDGHPCPFGEKAF